MAMSQDTVKNIEATIQELKAKLADVESWASRIRLTIGVLSELVNEKTGKEVKKNGQ
jgi:hypothetical protein